ncbi:MAG: hypothetical protein KKD18_01075 [Nanoarchaeota archaeon]|nr:hypothetical protein [Nanoarchaeota archaeon]MBU0976987.1 hypothetical protein [Nanoarchaeota archaeon]
MNYKRLALLIVLVAAVASLFFFSSWNNAMVVSGESISMGVGLFGMLSRISPLLAGFLAVVAVGVLVLIVFDR